MPIRISVIIPTFNRCQSLKRCLDSLKDQTYHKLNYEVVVVDDGSTDGTESFLKRYGGGINFIFSYYRQENKGPAAARNLGIRNAVGDLIAFTDDDCFAATDWLEQLAKGFTEEKVAGVGGTVSPYTSGMVSDYIHYMKVLEPGMSEGMVLYLVTANACYQRAIIDEVGGFSERIRNPGGEDPELSIKILEKGYELAYNPQSIIFHQHRETLRGMIRMFYNHGRGNQFINQRWGNKYIRAPDIGLFLQLVGLHRVAWKFAFYLASGLGVKRAVFFPFLWWIQQIAFAAGYRKGY